MKTWKPQSWVGLVLCRVYFSQTKYMGRHDASTLSCYSTYACSFVDAVHCVAGGLDDDFTANWVEVVTLDHGSWAGSYPLELSSDRS